MHGDSSPMLLACSPLENYMRTMHGEFCWRQGVLAVLEMQIKLRDVYVELWTYCDLKMRLSWSVR